MSLGLFACLLLLPGAPTASQEAKGTPRQSSAAGPRPDEIANKQTDLLLNAIVTWLAANFDLPANYDHPTIELAPAKTIAALRFGAAGTSGQSDVVAVYVDRTRTIVLPQDWTGRTPAELSVLVHELVHHLQDLDKRTYNCPQLREKLAYDAQEKWLGLFGRNLESEFGIDAMTLLVGTACM
jgi:hypothetical protein